MPAKIKITEDQAREFYRLRKEEKESYAAIGKRFGISAQTVQRRIIDLGVDLESIPIKFSYDRYYFYDIDSAAKAYWLGFITADGYVNEDRNFLQINLGWKDHDHLEKFIRAIQGDMEIKTVIHNITKNKIASLTINGKEMVKGLVANGVRQGKSCHEQPPTRVPDVFIPDYIRGLWDGDGHIGKRKIDLRSSFPMCSWVQNYLLKKCPHMHKGAISFESNIYRFSVCSDRIEVLDLLYYPGVSKEIVLDRKYKDAKIFKLRDIKSSAV